ncbi:MAG: membrane protein insertase YidC [Endomicrobium sp.]|jgi:YidC/Oxa1 family membrane protein insertase|nr:membrane protein insertase YidC [Endomicrobium sp.]
MQKEFVLFIILSTVTIFVWFSFFSQQPRQAYQDSVVSANVQCSQTQNENYVSTTNSEKYTKEEHLNVETNQYKAVFTNRGAAISSWLIKDKNGQWINLVISESSPVLINFPNLFYKIVSKSNNKIVFEYVSKDGWKITKIYNLSDTYMHNLSIIIEKTVNVIVPQIDVKWGPGLGTDNNELKENIALTRVLACSAEKPHTLKKLKNDFALAPIHQWAALDNRYFLVAFIPKTPMDFDKIIPSRFDKKHPYSVALTATFPENVIKKEYSVDFYLGPKHYTHLKTYKLDLEKTVDFGFFGFLGKIAFAVLTFFHKLTRNYGWSIIMITAAIQVVILPLTLKSLKSAAAMKRVQPIVKDIQTKYKDNPQRLKAEMLNVYRTQKVNPLGGCLPMFLQLPIFWAFFTMLRNAYELRNEGWILWIKDLSAPDQFMHLGSFSLNLLPIIMGLGMFLQQKMTAATSDPTQRKIMYIMPVVFTCMFWSFSSGLVIYWITSSIFSIIEQYMVIKKDSVVPIHS